MPGGGMEFIVVIWIAFIIALILAALICIASAAIILKWRNETGRKKNARLGAFAVLALCLVIFAIELFPGIIDVAGSVVPAACNAYWLRFLDVNSVDACVQNSYTNYAMHAQSVRYCDFNGQTWRRDSCILIAVAAGARDCDSLSEYDVGFCNDTVANLGKPGAKN